MPALLPFKATITPRHWNDKCFHRAGGDLICRFGICASHFQCIVGAQQEILCLTVRTIWLIWRVWPRSLGMSVPAWQRHREVELIEKCAMKTQHLVASTPFVHNQCHMTTLWYRSWLFGSFNWPRLSSWIGFFTARWQWQHVWAARARSSKQNTRANISVFCLQIWPSIKSRAINCFNKCVFRLLFTLEGMIWKREGIWHVFRMALHNSGIGVWRHDNSPYGLVVMSPSANLPRCVMPFWTHAHAFSLYDYFSFLWVYSCSLTKCINGHTDGSLSLLGNATDWCYCSGLLEKRHVTCGWIP